jgi:hypothetical protein
VAAVVGGVGLQDGEHDLGHPVPDGGRRLGLTVVGGAPEVVVLGNGRVVLQEPVQVLTAVFEVVLPAHNTASWTRELNGIAIWKNMSRAECLVTAMDGRCADLKTWWMKCFLASSLPISTAYKQQLLCCQLPL